MSKEIQACSFCGKAQTLVGHVIVGPEVNICNECIDICNSVIEKEMGHQQPLTPVAKTETTDTDKSTEKKEFDFKCPPPKEIKARLDEAYYWTR